jgi:hypothetical protein
MYLPTVPPVPAAAVAEGTTVATLVLERTRVTRVVLTTGALVTGLAEETTGAAEVATTTGAEVATTTGAEVTAAAAEVTAALDETTAAEVTAALDETAAAEEATGAAAPLAPFQTAGPGMV